ncbi:MAG: DUF5317 domain-containing protein [Actinomycetota bacterium]|nr:DUF5317 domain-containing protein [Actinomycetota bacterium]
MLLLASILVIGLLLGWGLGGGIRNLALLEVRWWWLIPLALVIQLAPIPQADSGPGRYLPFVLLIGSFLMIGAAVVVNWRLLGFPLILLGVLLNLVPIVINQGMPVSGAAVIEAGGSLTDVPRELGGKHHLERPEDALTFLADVIAVRSPFRAVVSIGDLVMWAGAAWFLTAAMIGLPPREAGFPRVPARTLRSSKT